MYGLDVEFAAIVAGMGIVFILICWMIDCLSLKSTVITRFFDWLGV